MYTGQLVFSQVTDHLPMHTFRRCVQRYQGERHVKRFRCLDQYLSMAFAQPVFVNKDVRSIIQAAFGPYDRSACNSLGGFSHTSETGSQFRVVPDQRAGFRFFAAS